MRACMCEYVRACVYVRVCVRMRVCARVCVRVHVHVCVSPPSTCHPRQAVGPGLQNQTPHLGS